MRAFRIVQPIFFISLTVLEIQGAQKGKNAIFEAPSNFYFSSNFNGIFFIGFLSVRAFRIVCSRFFLSLTVFEIKGAQKGKNVIFEATSNLYFSSNFDGIFLIIFLSVRAKLKRCRSQFFSISCSFRGTRCPKGQKRHFQGYIKFSFFI